MRNPRLLAILGAAADWRNTQPLADACIRLAADEPLRVPSREEIRARAA